GRAPCYRAATTPRPTRAPRATARPRFRSSWWRNGFVLFEKNRATESVCPLSPEEAGGGERGGVTGVGSLDWPGTPSPAARHSASTRLWRVARSPARRGEATARSRLYGAVGVC